MYSVTIFGLHLDIDPLAFTIPVFGGWKVYWYGILITAGILLALVYAWRNSKRFNIDFDRLLDVIIVGLPVSVLSARLYYIIFFGEEIRSIGDFFNFSGHGFSGLAIYGGVIGAAISAAVMCRVRKLKLLDVLDIASIGFLIGQGIGRWGNFFNQEAFGSATGSSFFGMTSENVAAELGPGVLAHPCFLYESIWCLIGAFLLHNISKTRDFSGQIAAWYCLWYGVGRAIIENFRTDSLMLGPFRVSQLLSLVLAVTGSVILIRNYIKKKKAAAESEYTPLFSDETADDTANAAGKADDDDKDN